MEHEANDPPTIVADYPAYAIIEPPRDHEGVIVLKSRDELALDQPFRGNDNWLHHFMIDSVASYALSDGRDPIAAIDRARKNGHDLHFIFGLGSSITAHKRAKKTILAIRVGDVVRFEGIVFEVIRTGHGHLGLKRSPPL